MLLHRITFRSHPQWLWGIDCQGYLCLNGKKSFYRRCENLNCCPAWEFLLRKEKTEERTKQQISLSIIALDLHFFFRFYLCWQFLTLFAWAGHKQQQQWMVICFVFTVVVFRGMVNMDTKKCHLILSRDCVFYFFRQFVHCNILKSENFGGIQNKKNKLRAKVWLVNHKNILMRAFQWNVESKKGIKFLRFNIIKTFETCLTLLT